MKYKRYNELSSQTCEPVKMSVVTQPNSAMPLREILERFSQGDNSVLAHLPVDDFTDETSDDDFLKDDSFDNPQQFDDRLQSEEFLIQQQENKIALQSLIKQQDDKQEEPIKDSVEEKEVE